MFVIGQQYSKNDLYSILNVPEGKRKGAWDTGYRKWRNDIFIFANVGTSGRVGSDYNNYWEGKNLIWYAKPTGHLVKELISPVGEIFLFTRSNNKSPFIFQGRAYPMSVLEQSPVKITWSIEKDSENVFLHPDEIRIPLKEGSYKSVKVNKYERNPQARQLCIDHYGAICKVCGFKFSFYGEIGKGYIHVHHLVLISSIGQEYEVNPIKDLLPVCANCHAMLHMRNPPYEIEEMKSIISSQNE